MNVGIISHKISAFMLSVMMLATNTAPAIASTLENNLRFSHDEYYEYELTEDGYKVKALTEEGSKKLKEDNFELTIPESHEDIPIIGLSDEALKDVSIRKLNLPAGFKFFGKSSLERKIEEEPEEENSENNEIEDVSEEEEISEEDVKGLEEIDFYPEDVTPILDFVDEAALKGNHLLSFPYIVKNYSREALYGNKIEDIDLTYTEKIDDYAFSGNKNLNAIVNKYSEISDKAFDDDAEISYVEEDFIEKAEEDEKVNYLRMREKMLEAKDRESKEDEETSHMEEASEGDEEASGIEESSEEDKTVKVEESESKNDDKSVEEETSKKEEESTSSKEDENSKEKEKETLTIDEIKKNSKPDFSGMAYQKPKKIDYDEYKMLREKHKAPSRLSFHFIEKAYASDTARDLDDVKIESISSKWILGEETGNPTFSDEDQIYKWHVDNPQFMRLKTDVAISGQKDHEIGTVQIRVPKNIVRKRDGSFAGVSDIGIAAFPSKDNAFAYLETEDEYLVINTKPLSAATSISFEMSFEDLKPHEIKDYEKTGYTADPFTARIEVLTKSGNSVKKDGNTLNAKFDTRAYIESSSKRAQKLYDDAYPKDWPAELKQYIDNEEDYVYVSWKTQAVNQGSQPFKVGILDKADTDGLNNVKILGVRRDKDMTYIVKDATNTASFDKVYPENGDYDFIEPGANFNLTIYTAYPKANFFDENGNIKQDEYNLRNEITYTLTSEDDQEVTEVTADGKMNYKPRPFPVPKDHVKILKEGAGGNKGYTSGNKYVGKYLEALNDLIIDRKVDINYNIDSVVVGEKYTKPENVIPYGISTYGRKTYTSEISDKEVIFDGRVLEKDEYDFKALDISLTDIYRYTVKYDNWSGYELTATDDFIYNPNIPERVWAYEKGRGRDKTNAKLYDDKDNLLAEIVFDEDGQKTITPKGGSKLNGGRLMLPAGVKGYKLVTESKESAYGFNIKPTVTINPSKKIVEDLKAKYAKSSTTTINVDNKAEIKLYETNKEDTGRNELSGEYYTEAYPEGHFMIFKWGDGEDTKLPNGGDFNMHKRLSKDTNRGTPRYRGIYSKHLNDLNDGKEVEVYYEVENEGYGMPWTYDPSKDTASGDKYDDKAFNQKSYKMTSRDDKVYFEAGKDLTVNDFEFTKIKLQKPQIFDYKKFDKDGFGLRESNQTRFNGVVRYGPIKKGDYGYVENTDVSKMPTFEIFGKVSGADYVKYGEVKFTDKDNYTLTTFNGAGVDGKFLVFPKGVIAYKVVAETKLDGIIWNQVPYVKLKQSDYIKSFVKNAFDKSDSPREVLNNEANLDIRASESDIGTINTVGQDELRGLKLKETDPLKHFRISKEGFGDVVKNIDPDDLQSERYGSYGMYLNRIENGYKDAEISYKVTNTGFGMPFTYDKDKDMFDMKSYGKVPYEMTSRDFFLSLNDEELNKEDFNFTGVKFNLPEIYDYTQYTSDGYGYIEGGLDWKYFRHLGGEVKEERINKGQYGYKLTNDYSKLDDFEVYGASDDEVYEKYADVSFKTGKAVISPTNGASVKDDELRFPEDAEITNYKVVLKTNMAAVRWIHEPQVLIKNSKKVVDMINKLYEEADLPSVDALNKVDLNVKLNVGEDDEKNVKIGEATGFDRLDGMIYGVRTSKHGIYTNDPAKEVVNAEYFLTTRIQTNIKNRSDLDYAIENGGFKPETRSIFYDLLPEEVKADPNSVQTEPGAKVISSNVISNYKNSGRDLLVVEVERTPNYTYVNEEDSFIGHEGYADTPYISFKATYSWQSLKDIGRTLRNYSVYRSLNKDFGNYKGFKGERNEPSGENHKETNIAFKLSEGEDEKAKGLLTDLDDSLVPGLDKSGISKDASFIYSSFEKYLGINVSSVASLNKTVDADGLGVYASGTEEDKPQNVYEGGLYTYKKTLKAMSSSNIKNIILYDKLEGYVPEGDKVDYGDTRWRGTYFGIDTSQLQNKGVDPVLYYSTRDDLVLDNTRDRSMNDISDKDIWTKWDDRPADLNNRDITGLALDVRKNQDGSDFVLKEDASFSYYIKMKAPVLDKDGEKNSKSVYAKTDEEKSEWYDKDREIVDNQVRKVKVPIGTDSEGNILYKELTFFTPIYEAEEGLTGGAHAYNNIVAIYDTMGEKGSTELIRHDYTKVGLKPFKINVKKDWKDDNNRDGIRLETLKVEIYANDKLYKTIDLKNDENWEKELLVPYGDDNGKKIDYTVKEVVPEGYKFDKLNKVENGEGLSLVLENSHEPEKVSVKANKTWTDLENLKKEKRPQSITLELYSDENGPMEKVDEAVVKADSEGNWSYEFKNLNKYHDEGKLIKYEVKEKELADFITTVEDGEFENNEKLVKINNAYYPYGDLIIKKTVENASREAIENNEFKFMINIEKDDSDRIVGDYKAYKEDKNGKKIGSDFLVTDGSEVSLKNGERVVIKDIDSRFTYKVSEKDAKAFTLTGMNNREGSISAGGVNEEAFVNRYETKGKAELKLKKDLDGRKLYGYDFRFNVYEIIDGKEELITKNPIANDKNGDIRYNFNYDSKDLGFNNGFVNKTVTKKYVVREVNEGKNDEVHGFFYDDKAIFVDVTLTDDGFGNINTNVTYNKEGWFNEDDQSFTFNNKYRAEIPYELETFKYVKDGIKIKENQFKFSLIQVGVYENKNFKDPAKRKEYVEGVDETVHFGNYMNGKVVDEAYSDENGKAVFKKYDGKDFIFNQYDIGKTFVFDIKEIDNSANDDKVIFDGFTVRRYVSVYDGGFDRETKKGTLQIDESTEYLIDESSLDKAKADAKRIVEKYRREDAESIIKKIDDAESVEDVKKVLKETEGLFPLFVNEYKPGKIEVSKNVTKGDPNNPGKEFKFRIKLKGEDSKIPDGSLEMKREGNKILPAPGWKLLNENQKDTTDGFTYEYEKKDGEDEIIRGEDDIGPFVGWDYGLNADSPYTDSRIVKFYGEKKASDFKVAEAKEGQNLNTYLQSLLPQYTSWDEFNYGTKNDNINNETNWLIYNDNGIEKLIPRKPLKHSVSWDDLDEKGLIYGQKELTINNKRYKVRLMRAFDDTTKDYGAYPDKLEKYAKGSEWNRLMLPILKDGRYDSKTEKFVEKGMPVLANYSLGSDFGGNGTYNGRKWGFFGIYKWTQDKITKNNVKYRVIRGDSMYEGTAASVYSSKPSRNNEKYGWQPVLEEVKDNSMPKSSTNKNTSIVNFEKTFMKKAYAVEQEATQKSESTISTGDPVWEVDSSDTENLTILFRNERPVLKISFDANGGQGSMIDIEYDNNIPEGSDVKFYRPNYRFAGWKFYHNGVEIDRSDLDSIPKPDKVVAKAEWEKRDLKVDFVDGVGYFTLLDGENGYFDGIPANMDYEIEELTDEEWYNENPKYKDLSQEEKNKLIADAGWSLDSVENNKGKTLSDDTVSANFVNSFEPGKTKVTIEGLKTLNGKTTDVNGYKIRLYNADSSWNIGSQVDEAVTDDAGRFKFKDLNYVSDDLGQNSSKTYYYIVKEHNDNKTNIIYDETSYKVQVNVTKVEKNGEILLNATVNYLDDDLVIKNETQKTAISIKKNFKDEVSKNAASGKTFKVEVKLSDRANPVILDLNEANGYSGTIDNLEIGTSYSVSEVDIPEGFKLETIGNESGITTDKTTEVTVTNSYSSNGKVKIKLTKEMLGRNLKAGEFKFQVFNEDGTKALSDVYTNGSENGPGEIVLEVNEDTPGMKTYQIKEIPTDDDTVIFDTDPITVKVNMTDDTEGNLVAGDVTVVGDKDRFTNKLKPGNLVIEKIVDNLLSTDARFNVKVTLFDKDKKEITGKFNYKSSNGDKGIVKSGDTLSIGNKESITIENLPLGTEYKIEEVNNPLGFKLKDVENDQGIIKEYDGDYKAVVHNEYEAKGNFILRGKKTYKNNPSESLKGKKFRFALLELKPGKKWSDGIDPDDVIYVNTDDDGIINIGPIAVRKDDLYVGDDSEGNKIYDMTKRYKLIEEKGIYGEDGKLIEEEHSKIKYDPSNFEIDVEFEEDNGEIKVKNKTIRKNGKEVATDDFDFEFTNEYIEEKLTSIDINKEVKGHKEGDNTRFTMRVKLTYPDKTERIMNLKLGHGENYKIDKLPIGTEYEITEIGIDNKYRLDGYKVDENPISKSESITGIANDTEVRVSVINEVKPKRVKISAQKLLNGKVTSRKFSFNLYEEGKDDPIQTKENVRKLVDFDEIIYEDGFTGPKTYFIKELSVEGDGIIYDKSIFKVVVSEEEGSDELTVKYYKDDKEVEAATFENKFTTIPSSGRMMSVFYGVGGILLLVALILIYLYKKKERKLN